MDMGKTGFWIAGFVGLIGFLTPALATEQVYHPVSPTFGGNPNNGPFLLSTAQAQGEGANSGNTIPTINFTNPTTPTTPGGQQSQQGGAANNNTVANPLVGRAGMP
jgi:curli production assembly/transport component CsgF